MAYDYTWLKSEVLDWIHRPTLAPRVPTFVALAEKRINGELEARLQQVSATLATSAGIKTVSLPADFDAMHALSLPNYGKITPLTAQALADLYAGGTSGAPRNYALVGGNLVLGPCPDAAYSLALTYRAQIPPLADAPTGTNWLLTQHHDIYLAATLCEAFLYMRDSANLQVWEGKCRTAIAALNMTDWNSAGSMAVRADAKTY